MLSANDIHFLIEQDVNIGSYQNRGWEPEEIDEAVNTTVFDVVNKALNKEIKEREKIEVLLLQSLTKKYCQTPVNNTVDKPEDYTQYVNATTDTIQNCCKVAANKILEGKYYQAVSDVLYNGKWYKKDEVIVGKPESNFFGEVNEVMTKQRDAIFIDNTLFNSYSKPIVTTYYTIIGSEIQLKSYQTISVFCLNYIASLTDFKIDSCHGKTLLLPENLQRWIIEKTILRLSIRNGETQEKISNMKSK